MNAVVLILSIAALYAVFAVPATGQTTDADEACVPLAEQYPNLGTEQSVSARREFTTVWGSFELPGGPCGNASAEAHYNALL